MSKLKGEFLASSLVPEIYRPLVAPPRSQPPVLRALFILGVTTKTVAECIGVAPPTVSNWSAGRIPIPADRARALDDLLRFALSAARHCEQRSRTRDHLSPVKKATVETFRSRIAEVEVLVGETRP